jgi:hypothetical protein
MAGYTDQLCLTLAKFFKEKVNKESQEKFGINFVNGIRDWDDYNISLKEYPVLKVIRLSDIYQKSNDRLVSRILIRYVLSFPQQNKLGAICHEVGKILHNSLTDLYAKIGIELAENQRDIVIEYRTANNESSQAVYSFLNLQLTFLDKK